VSFSAHEKVHCNIISVPFTLVFGVFATEGFKNTHLNWTMFFCPPWLSKLKCKMRVFPLNLALKYVSSSDIHIWSAELDRGKLDLSEPDHAEPNQGLHHQIMCDLHSSEIFHGIEWVTPSLHSGTIYQSQLRGSKNPKERTQHDGS